MATKRAKKRAPQTPAEPEQPRALHYKVVELSSVDEHSLERTLNEWVPQGWKFDGVQFAMRESSKRPSMAFVFFTREGAPLAVPTEIVPHLDNYRDAQEAEQHLSRLAQPAKEEPMQSAWERLHVLAADNDDKGEP